MIEVCQFFFTSFWHFVGLVMVIVITGGMGAVVASNLPRRNS